MPTDYRQCLSALGYEDLDKQEPLDGGCINQTSRVFVSNTVSDKDHCLILKQNPAAPEDMFAAEAEGLTALAGTNTLRIPEVIHVDKNFVLLEDLGQGIALADFWQRLGVGLAELHKSNSPVFGFTNDNYCGSTYQINTQMKTGHEFYAAYRIRHLVNLAQQRGLLNNRDSDALNYIADKLDRWIPEKPAVLIHGDLWRGNVHCTAEGLPALIDPAAYWGWAEAELAMTLLFGGFEKAFYDSYEEASEIDNSWRERAPLYNLYHLLNHLVLFGSSYLEQIRSIYKRFV